MSSISQDHADTTRHPIDWSAKKNLINQSSESQRDHYNKFTTWLPSIPCIQRRTMEKFPGNKFNIWNSSLYLRNNAQYEFTIPYIMLRTLELNCLKKSNMKNWKIKWWKYKWVKYIIPICLSKRKHKHKHYF